jgi:hypothetical protein
VNKAKRLINLMIQAVMLVGLVVGMVILFRAVSRGGGSSPFTQSDLSTGLPYPPPGENSPMLEATPSPAEIISALPYPPPDETVPAQEITPLPTVEYIELTPGEFWPPTETPFPTLPPYPSSTLRPGPTETPIPLAGPAKDASGNIYFFSRQEGEMYSYNLLPIDAAGEAKAGPSPLFTDLKAPFSWAFPSPDGQQFLLEDIRFEMFKGDLLDTRTGETKEFSVSIVVNMFLNWFPDSRRILFRDGNGSLVLVDPVSGETTRLSTSMYDTVEGAAASPDGKQVIYSLSSGMDGPSQVWLVNSDGRDEKMLFEYPYLVHRISWSPDGKKIVFLGDGLIVMDADGSNLTQLGNFRLAPCYSQYYFWSPDSRWLAMVVARNPAASCNIWSEDVFEQTDILLLDLESGKSVPLVPGEIGGNIDPAWSPDGSQIAFISNRSGAPEIWTIHVDGTHLRQLTNTGGFVRYPIWRVPK